MHIPSSPAMERDLRSPRPRRARTRIAIASALVLTACAGVGETVDPGEVESLRGQVTALTERDAARAQRLEELETTTARLARTNPITRVTKAERELALLANTLAVLDEELAEAVTANEQRDAAVAGTTEELAQQNAQLQGTLGELRGQLDTAVGRIDRVSGEIEDLEVRYLTLRDRLDRVSP